ncbi:hypothetical protein [Methyloglobulus sp.]
MIKLLDDGKRIEYVEQKKSRLYQGWVEHHEIHQKRCLVLWILSDD